jgi:hypothetical protein
MDLRLLEIRCQTLAAGAASLAAWNHWGRKDTEPNTLPVSLYVDRLRVICQTSNLRKKVRRYDKVSDGVRFPVDKCTYPGQAIGALIFQGVPS